MPTIRIADFDTWRPGYGQATVRVVRAGTSTLLDVFSDEALTTEVDNPQTLIERVVEGVSYGRFAQPLYVGEPYELEINSVDRTGVTRPPLTSLDGEDASNATVEVDGGSVAHTLKDHLARRIDVRDFGPFVVDGEQNASAATNNATILAALGAAGSLGGGYVEVPAGTYTITSFTIPQGVVLRGSGREATILQSTLAGNVITIGGVMAGLCRITVDGVSQAGNSVGVYARAKDRIVFDDVQIKRFETGLKTEGGMGFLWFDLCLSDCVKGWLAHGHDVGGAVEFNYWCGGKVELCSSVGIEFRHDGALCTHNNLHAVAFDTNTGKAVYIIGARATHLSGCKWEGNSNNLTVEDGSPVTTENTVIGVEITDGSIEDGTIVTAGTAEAISFRRMTFQDVAVTLTTPTKPVLVEDCREISGVTISAGSTAWVRRKTFDDGSAASGLTTGNAATKAWSITLAPGQAVYLEARVVARGRNTTDSAFYHIAVSARRPGASLAYDTQTANFTPGQIVTGAVSGASGRIINDSDSGSTGTLTLQDVVGEFQDNELITDPLGGSAIANGSLSFSNAAVVGSVTTIRTAQETDSDFDATFVANGPEIELRVTGDTGKVVEWVGEVQVVSS